VRIHTDLLVDADFPGAAPAHIDVEFERHGSRKRTRAYEVRLSTDTKVPGDGRRRPNSGRYGSAGGWAATYDEWGAFIAQLYSYDPEALIGPYTSERQFHEATHGRYL
jgi:hypothetical protein